MDSGITVEILMATYNGEKYLAEQIESIRRQTYCDWHLIISDDHSCDNTRSIIAEFEELDGRITHVYSDERFGCARDNFFYLMKHSTAEYVMFCDQDDVWLPEKVEESLAAITQLRKLAKDPDAPLMVFSDMKVVDSKLNVINESFNEYSHLNPSKSEFSSLLAQNIAAGCTMTFNRRLVEKVLPQPCDSRIIMHDWWLMLIASAFGEIKYLPYASSLYRQHDANSVGAQNLNVFSVLKKSKSMTDRVLATMDQAAAFVYAYGSMMPSDNLLTAQLYSSISKDPSCISRLRSLFRSGAVKSGIRVVGQVLVVAFLKGMA